MPRAISSLVDGMTRLPGSKKQMKAAAAGVADWGLWEDRASEFSEAVETVLCISFCIDIEDDDLRDLSGGDGDRRVRIAPPTRADAYRVEGGVVKPARLWEDRPAEFIGVDECGLETDFAHGFLP